jgi:hypothetical protein
MKYSIKISVEAANENEAQANGQLLQNITDNTDQKTKNFLYQKIMKKPDYFKRIAEKLQSPIIQSMLG